MSDLPNFTDDQHLLPAVAQDAASGQVLMLAYMNRDAWLKTLETGEATYYSRSRGRLWKKGESSGHVQRVQEIWIDCDADTILLRVEQQGGAACHMGYASCFFRRYDNGNWQTVDQRVFDPDEAYGGVEE